MTDNNKNDMNVEEEEVSGVSISTPTIDAIKNLCMRSRAAAATIISSSGTIAYPRDTCLDTSTKMNSFSIKSENISTKINVHIGGKGLNSNIIVPQNTYGNESPNDESSKECSSSFDQQTTMDNLLSLEATLEHVSRVQIRTKNIVAREGPFSFPKTVGGFPRTLHTPKPAWSSPEAWSSAKRRAMAIGSPCKPSRSDRYPTLREAREGG